MCVYGHVGAMYVCGIDERSGAKDPLLGVLTLVWVLVHLVQQFHRRFRCFRAGVALQAQRQVVRRVLFLTQAPLTTRTLAQVYEARLAALLAARNDRKDEHKRAQERYKKVRSRLALLQLVRSSSRCTGILMRDVRHRRLAWVFPPQPVPSKFTKTSPWS